MKQTNQKGFTLIELLVVVAIIGILAAVGVVAFQGFLSNARDNTTRANHNAVVKWMQAEVTKCSLGNTNLTYDTAGGIGASSQACTATLQAAHCAPMIVHLNLQGFDNPHDQTDALVASGTAAGDTQLTCVGNTATVTTTVSAASGSGDDAVAAVTLTDTIVKE
mgnify:CR=1 FL=1|tara:strand:- start:352 stop:843 length:492 start_codon:yes stop_codon:yes gene_type:complete